MSDKSWKSIERLSRIFVPVVLIIAMLAGLLFYQNQMLEGAQNRIYRTLRDSSATQVNSIRVALEDRYTLLTTCAELISPHISSEQEILARMSTFADVSEFSRIMYINKTGRAFTNEGQIAAVADRDYFLKALAGEKTIERIYSGRVDSSEHVTLAVPVYAQGEIIGVMAGTYPETSLRELISSRTYDGMTSSFLCDGQGQIVVGNDSSAYFDPQSNLLDSLEDARYSLGSYAKCRDDIASGKDGIIRCNIGQEDCYAVYQPIGQNDWMIFCVVPYSAVQAEIDEALQSGYLIILYVMIIATIFVALVAYLVQRQNRQLVEEKERLRLSDERFHIALDNSSVSIWDYDFATRSIVQSGHSILQHGFESVVPDVPESLIRSGYIHPDSAEEFREMYRRLLAGEEKVEGIFRVRTADRTGYWYEHIHYTCQYDAHGAPCRAIGMSQDVTEKYETELAYKRELSYRQTESGNVHSRVLLDVTKGEIVELSFLGKMVEAPSSKFSFDSFFRRAAQGVVSDDGVRAYFYSITPEMLRQNYNEGNTTITFDSLARLRDDSTSWVCYESHLLQDPVTGDLMDFIYLKDIDEEKRRMAELSQAAELDSMTGIYNHAATLQYITRFLTMEGRFGSHVLFMLDIDNFKSVNDTLGHQRGDSVIMQVAGILKNLFHGADILGRIGGDEFLVLMKNVSSLDVIHRKARDLVSAMQFVCSSPEGSVALSGSIGVGIYQRGDTCEMLYAKADSAMYTAKQNGKNQYAVCDGRGTSLMQHSEDGGGSTEMIQYQTLLEYIDGGVIMIEAGDPIRITYVSPSFTRLVRKKDRDAEITGKTILEQIHQEDLPLVRDAVYEAAASGKVVDKILRVHTDSGMGWHHLRMVRIPNDNTPPQLIAVISDITEFKKSAMQLEAIVNHSPNGILLLGVSDPIRILYHNPAYLEITGYTQEEFEHLGSDDALAFVCSEDRMRLREEIAAAMKEKRIAEATYRALHANGSTRYMSARGVMLEERDGIPVMQVVLSDVTKAKHSEFQLRLLKETYRIAMEQTGATLWRVDLATHALYTTRADLGAVGTTEKLLPNGGEDLIASGLIDPSSHTELRRMFKNLYDGNDSEDYLLVLNMEGGRQWHRCQFRLLHDELEAGCFAVGITCPAPNIDAEMVSFQQEQNFYEIVKDSLQEMIHVNLTKDQIVMTEFYDGKPDLNTRHIGTYSKLYAATPDFIAQESDRRMMLEKTSPQYLTEYFRSGSDWMFLEYRCKTHDEHIRWSSETIKLMRHPINGDLYAFMYLRDIDEKHRWELAIPCKPERDSGTYLFTRETAEAMIRYVISTQKDSGRQCAVGVFELVNLAHIREERGIAVSSGALLTIGRLFRVLIDGKSFAARLDEAHLLVFHADVPDGEEYRKQIGAIIEKILEAQERSGVEEPIELVSGLSIERASDADYGEMLHDALMACVKAAKHTSSNVSVYQKSPAPLPAPVLPAVQVNAPPASGEAKRPLQGRHDYYRTLMELSPDTLAAMGVLIADVNEVEGIEQSGIPDKNVLIEKIGEIFVGIFHYQNVFCFSGEQFLVFCPDVTEEAFTARCREALERIGSDYPNSLSTGYVWDDHVTSIQKMVIHATELVNVSSQGKRHLSEAEAANREQMESWLRESLRQKRFQVYLQPKATVISRKVVGCEALVRYCDANGNLVSPAQFIPVLEQANLIRDLDLFMLQTVIDLLVKWQQSDRELYPVAINFSRKTLLDPATFDAVQQIVASHNDLIPYVEIEITETLGAIERSTIILTCERYRSAGFRLALDDFGSEYSSLQILAALRFDTIKIDKSVIDEIGQNEIAQLIVENTRRITRRQNALLVAEGIETEEQLSVLQRLGCDLLQGYLINKPLPIADFERIYRPATEE